VRARAVVKGVLAAVVDVAEVEVEVDEAILAASIVDAGLVGVAVAVETALLPPTAIQRSRSLH